MNYLATLKEKLMVKPKIEKQEHEILKKIN